MNVLSTTVEICTRTLLCLHLRGSFGKINISGTRKNHEQWLLCLLTFPAELSANSAISRFSKQAVG